MTGLNAILNREPSENNEVRKIQIELMNIWSRQKQEGLNRLSASYRFFTFVDDDGNMLYSQHCEHTEDMRMGGNGIDDFNRFVTKHLCIAESLYDEDLNAKAEEVANAYVKDQSRRLANFIVKVAPLAISKGDDVSVYKEVNK